MANVVPWTKNLTTGQPQFVQVGDSLTDEAGNAIATAPSWAYFQANSLATSTIAWSKLAGTSDITVSVGGTITLATAGVYEIIVSNVTSTSAATKDVTLRVPAGGAIVASSTENQGTGGGTQSIVYTASFAASGTFSTIISAGFNATNTENQLSVKRIA